MRKTLLLGVALGIGVTAVAQNSVISYPVKSISRVKKNALIDAPSMVSAVNPVTTAKNNIANRVAPSVSTQAFSKVPMGSSYNLYSVIVEEVTYLTANQATGLIQFTHRQNAGQPGGSGYVQSSFSADGGSQFDTTASTLVMDQGWACRYPSGVIYNPVGNTNYNNAFRVVFGPYTGGSGWTAVYWGSEKYDNTLNDQDSLNNTTNPALAQTQGSQYFMSMSDNGTAHNFGIRYETDSLGALILNTGTWDLVNNKMNWAQQEFDHNFAIETDGSEGVANWGMAWSQDGLTGYVLFLGRDAVNDYGSYYPIIYKTINGGATWTVSTPDFGTIANLTNNLWPSTTGATRPIWIGNQAIDYTVDNLGNLHILGTVKGQYSTHPDSLGYTYNGEPYKLFDVYSTATGWDAQLLDTIWTAPLEQTGDNSGLTMSPYDVRYGARIQASRTTDGTKIFVGWQDTDTLLSWDNLYPDLHMKGIDVATRNVTPTVNFSKNTSEDGNIYWLAVSDITLVQGGNTYVIPCGKSETRNGQDATAATGHFFLKDVMFTDADFASGISEGPSQANFTVTQNRPNPFDGTSSFDIVLKESASVKIEVINMLGQAVSSSTANMGPGANTVAINASDLKSGIYFYSVTIGDQKVSRRMIVK
jgi:hypothetical protein